MSLAKKSKVNLPKDWIVNNSTSFPDRVYYFNVRTGESSWTEPRGESNKPKPGGASQKRKFQVENGNDEIPTRKMCSPTSAAPQILPDRKLLRAKRYLEPPKAQETAQMKEMRRKILEKKQSKVAQTAKAKPQNVPSGSRSEKSNSSVSSKSNRSVKPNSRRRYLKAQAANEAEKTCKRVPDTGSTSGSEVSYERSKSLPSSSATGILGNSRNRNSSRTQAGRESEGRIDSSVSSSTPGDSNVKKNLARKRLDSLKQNLTIERKKIEPDINDKMVRRMLFKNNEPKIGDIPSSLSAKHQSKEADSPTEGLPSISHNVESRFNSLRARLITNAAFSNDPIGDDAQEPVEAAVKAPKIVKTNKKPAKKRGKAGTAVTEKVIEEPHSTSDQNAVENQNRDSFWEAMDWEPIEEEKVIFEVQEVRMQLSTDQGAQPKPPDYSINNLELPQVSQNTDNRVLYVVVDTNVYLSNLKMVTELLEDSGKTNKCYRPVVVVPWTVLQELDYIKDNKSKTKSVHLQKSAKTAVDMLFRYFSSKHPRLKGQTGADAAENRMKYQVESPDDEILQSCLQIRESGCTVVLLSNDKNLCTKAMIHDISTYGRHQSIQEMLRNEVESVEPLQVNKSQGEVVDSTEAEISDDIFCEAKAIIKNFLSIIVSKEMENLYGEEWRKYTIVKPPWSVADVLKCVSKHWIAAISDVFLKQAETLVAKLSTMFLNAPKYGQSLRYVSEVLDVCHDLAQMVKVKNYQELSEKTQGDIKELIDSCKAKMKEVEGNKRISTQAVIEYENNNLNDEQRADNAFKYFEQIWTFTNNLCGHAADLTGIPHSITYKAFDPAFSAETINRIQPELVFSLNQLIHALRTVLNDDEYLTLDHPALIALYQSMITYFPNSGELTDTRSLDIVDLLCCIRVKKDFLRTGLVQLQELCCQFCRIADFRSTTNIALN